MPTCEACGTDFQHKTRSTERFCSKSCCLKVWRRKRHEADPDKVRAEWRRAHESNRSKRLVRMNAYYQKNRDRVRAQVHEHRKIHGDRLREIDRDRWSGDRRDRSNEVRKVKFQETRIFEPWSWLLKVAEERAKRKGVPFSLTRAWGESRWTGRCELSGLEFRLGARTSGPKFWSPSIDRITPAAGYIPDNCRFVIWGLNAFKGEASDEEMILVAKAFLDKNALLSRA